MGKDGPKDLGGDWYREICDRENLRAEKPAKVDPTSGKETQGPINEQCKKLTQCNLRGKVWGIDATVCLHWGEVVLANTLNTKHTKGDGSAREGIRVDEIMCPVAVRRTCGPQLGTENRKGWGLSSGWGVSCESPIEG